jgi:riboflavin synthase
VRLGDSVAVNGVCLTVVAIDGEDLSFEAVRETLERTTLGQLDSGRSVNLERAMRADARFDGHLVQGHIDGIGRVAKLERTGDASSDVRLFIECAPELANLLVDKGSVAIDGVSLTVVATTPRGFHVVLIPHTLAVTTLSTLCEGNTVNLEVDVIGKYVARYLSRLSGRGPEGAAR